MSGGKGNAGILLTPPIVDGIGKLDGTTGSIGRNYKCSRIGDGNVCATRCPTDRCWVNETTPPVVGAIIPVIMHPRNPTRYEMIFKL